jgi:hypothetical protein
MAREDEGSCLTVLHECKHTAQVGPKLTGTRLDVKLVEAALEKAQFKYGDSSSSSSSNNSRISRKFAVVVMSNRLLAGNSAELIAKMCESAPLVLVASDNAVDYFGPSLAPRFLGYVEP